MANKPKRTQEDNDAIEILASLVGDMFDYTQKGRQEDFKEGFMIGFLEAEPKKNDHIPYICNVCRCNIVEDYRDLHECPIEGHDSQEDFLDKEV